MTRVVVVCTGNVVRSPALACLLGARRPDLAVESAGVGGNAVGGLGMRRRMSEFLLEAGYGEYAAAHRSRRWEQVAEPDGIDLVIGVAPVHMRRLAEIAPGMRSMMTQERITDPVFGNQADYLLAWEQIMDAARWLAEVIPS